MRIKTCLLAILLCTVTYSAVGQDVPPASCQPDCLNGGHCDLGSLKCVCLPGYDGDACQNLVKCNDPGVPMNGERYFKGNISTTPGSFIYADTVTFSCMVGYALSGDKSRTCQDRGEWNGTQPTCTVVSCQDPGQLVNGARYFGSNQSSSIRSFHYSNAVTFECNEGYILTGSSKRTCQASGQWNGTQPICTAVSCQDPGQLVSGARFFESSQVTGNHSFQYSDTVTFQCNEGYILSGSSKRTCQVSGQWNGTQPTCNVVTCQDPGLPKDAKRYLEGSLLAGQKVFTFGQTLVFSCDKDHKLSGNSQRTCLATGQWNGTQPSCAEEKKEPPSKDDGDNKTVIIIVIVICVLLLIAIITGILVYQYRKRKSADSVDFAELRSKDESD